MGVGVAGLQAIATSRRLGAAVKAYDVRAAAKEEAESLGATFLDLGVSAEGVGGYARELTDDELAVQQRALASEVAASDVVITTAAVPGRKAPVLVTAAMVDAMGPGSVVVDMAADSGGNCEVTVPGEEIRRNHALVVGLSNPPAQMGTHASFLYARNVLSLLALYAAKGEVAPDWTDEVVIGATVVRDGACTNETAASAARPAFLADHRAPGGGELMENQLLEYFTVFVLSVVVGFEVVSKVPSILHTPLMSGSNAIHGVILVGAMLVLGNATSTPEIVLGTLAVLLATLNVVGGFVVTDRMLEMFKGKPDDKRAGPVKPDDGDGA